MADIERVLALGHHLGEGPIWSSKEQALYWIDITPGEIHRWSPDAKTHETFTLGYTVGCLALRRSGGLIIAAKRGFMFWDARQGPQQVANPIADQPALRFNDGKVDPSGRFFAGSMHEVSSSLQTGDLYRLDADLSVRTVEAQVRVPNGIGWSLDNKTMYFTDSPHRTIYAFDYDAATGHIENKRPFITVPESGGMPDGMTVDSEGCIWCARWGGWKIVRHDPDGKVEREIAMPVERPTSCAFGGKNLDELYITSAALGMPAADRAGQPWAGDLLRIFPGVKGREEPQFAG